MRVPYNGCMLQSALAPWAKSFVTLHLRAERNASAHTVRAYTHDLDCYLAFAQKEYPGLPLTRSHRIVVRAYLVHLHDQVLGRNSILRAIAVLRAFYKYLIREEAVLQ